MSAAAEQMRSRISDVLARLPGEHNPVSIRWASIKIEAATQLALQKLQERGIALESVPEEGRSQMIDWILRLAFSEQNRDLDVQGLQSLVRQSFSAKLTANDSRF